MNSMTNYEWSEEFYNEIIKDHNYRFPKFMEISYPKYGKEDDNKWLNFSINGQVSGQLAPNL